MICQREDVGLLVATNIGTNNRWRSWPLHWWTPPIIRQWTIGEVRSDYGPLACSGQRPATYGPTLNRHPADISTNVSTKVLTTMSVNKDPMSTKCWWSVSDMLVICQQSNNQTSTDYRPIACSGHHQPHMSTEVSPLRWWTPPRDTRSENLWWRIKLWWLVSNWEKLVKRILGKLRWNEKGQMCIILLTRIWTHRLLRKSGGFGLVTLIHAVQAFDIIVWIIEIMRA